MTIAFDARHASQVIIIARFLTAIQISNGYYLDDGEEERDVEQWAVTASQSRIIDQMGGRG